MVGLWGMSDDPGPVSHCVDETHRFVGRELREPREYAEATATQLRQATRRLLEEAHQRAREVLDARRKKLGALVGQLLTHRTVDPAALDALLATGDRPAAATDRPRLPAEASAVAQTDAPVPGPQPAS